MEQQLWQPTIFKFLQARVPVKVLSSIFIIPPGKGLCRGRNSALTSFRHLIYSWKVTPKKTIVEQIWSSSQTAAGLGVETDLNRKCHFWSQRMGTFSKKQIYILMENITYYFFLQACHIFITFKNKLNKILWVVLVPPLQFPEAPGISPSSLSKSQEAAMLEAQLCSSPPGRQETREVPNLSFANMEKFPQMFWF